MRVSNENNELRESNHPSGTCSDRGVAMRTRRLAPNRSLVVGEGQILILFKYQHEDRFGEEGKD